MEQSEVSAVNTLAMEAAKLTRIREEQQAETLKDQAAILKEHGSLLSSIDKQLSVLVERTSGLAELTEREPLLNCGDPVRWALPRRLCWRAPQSAGRPANSWRFCISRQPVALQWPRNTARQVFGLLPQCRRRKRHEFPEAALAVCPQ